MPKKMILFLFVLLFLLLTGAVSPPAAEIAVAYDRGRGAIAVPKTIADKIIKETDVEAENSYIFTYSGKIRNIYRTYKLNNDIDCVILDGERKEITVKTIVTSAFLITENENYFYITPVSPRGKYERIVVIDPGHGGEDTGMEYGGVIESQITLCVARQLYAMLEDGESGIKAYMTRYGDERVHRYNRAAFSNNTGDIFVSIHADASPDEPWVNGVHSYFSPLNTVELSRLPIAPEALAEIMTNELAAAANATNNGVEPDDELSVLIRAKIPAVLTEIGFATNPLDHRRLQNPLYLENAAKGIYNGILEAYKK